MPHQSGFVCLCGGIIYYFYIIFLFIIKYFLPLPGPFKNNQCIYVTQATDFQKLQKLG